MIKILIFLMFIINTFSQDCLMIRGGGFSGFWYFYKKSNIINKKDKVYCVSSGCLAIVSNIKNNDFDFDIALVSAGGFGMILSEFIYSELNSSVMYIVIIVNHN